MKYIYKDILSCSNIFTHSKENWKYCHLDEELPPDEAVPLDLEEVHHDILDQVQMLQLGSKHNQIESRPGQILGFLVLLALSWADSHGLQRSGVRVNGVQISKQKV